MKQLDRMVWGFLLSSLVAANSAVAQNGADQPADGSADVAGVLFEKAEALRAEKKFKAALSLYRNIEQKHPASTHNDVSGFWVGDCLAGLGKHQEAKSHLQKYIAKSPAGPWRGQASIALFDIVLETEFDTARAAVPIRRALKIIEATDIVKRDESWHAAAYGLHVRAGVTCYLELRYDEAVKLFRKALPYAPKRNVKVVHGYPPTDIGKLINAAQQKKRLTPKSALKGNPKARRMLLLSDLYHVAGNIPKSFELCDRLIKEKLRRVSQEQRSWALFKRGRNYYSFRDDKRRNPKAAFHDYMAAIKAAPQSPWADRALFLAANIKWNDEQDVDAAIALWRRLLKEYPNSKEVGRAAHFICVAYEWSKRYDEALAAYEEILKKYPNTIFTKLTREHYEKLKEKMKKKTKP